MSQETQNAPSIGSVELSFDPKGNRVRRIVSDPLSSSGQLAGVLSEAQMFGERQGATRAVVRGLVPDRLMQEAEDTAICFRWGVEAAIQLSGEFDGFNFVYFTRNSTSRFSHPEVIREEAGLVRNIHERPVKPPTETLQGAMAEGFTFEFLEGEVTTKDHLRLMAMYEHSFKSYPFPIAEAIGGMIADPNVHVFAARSISDGELYAVSATELVVLPGSGFAMREMGDSAKMPGVNGLNAPLKIMLTAESLKRDNKIDLVFCESRAALGAVNSINHKIGMQFSGMLPKHTVISGPSDVDEVNIDGVNGKYGNMNVWAFNETQIRSVANQVYQ